MVAIPAHRPTDEGPAGSHPNPLPGMDHTRACPDPFSGKVLTGPAFKSKSWVSEDHMAIHIVTQVDGEELKITLSRDDAGNYVAEAARMVHGGPNPGTETPRLRVVDPVKEQALRSLFDALHRLAASRQRDPPGDDPGPPAAA